MHDTTMVLYYKDHPFTFVRNQGESFEGRFVLDENKQELLCDLQDAEEILNGQRPGFIPRR
jgi:hypothetical protein